MDARTSNNPAKEAGGVVERHEIYSDEQFQLDLAEYNALRNEILKRSEYRYQLVSLNLIIAGTIFTLGLQTNSPSYILFVFPVLGCFLIIMWAHNLVLTRWLSEYIREHIESKYKREGWETAVVIQFRSIRILRSSLFSISGIFLGTEIMAFGLGLIKSTLTTIDIILIITDVLAILITLMVLKSLKQT